MYIHITYNQTDSFPEIQRANCPAHIFQNCAKQAGDKLQIHIESLVLVLNRLSAPAKRAEELKAINLKTRRIDCFVWELDS
jgi:hypothetical protein